MGVRAGPRSSKFRLFDSSWLRETPRPACATSPRSGQPLPCAPSRCATSGASPKAWPGAATATASPPPGSPAAAPATTAASAAVSARGADAADRLWLPRQGPPFSGRRWALRGWGGESILLGEDALRWEGCVDGKGPCSVLSTWDLGGYIWKSPGCHWVVDGGCAWAGGACGGQGQTALRRVPDLTSLLP